MVEYLQRSQLPLTVCPCSNVSLHVYERMDEHVIAQMLDLGLNVTINSDDPAHFGAYLQENMQQVQTHCSITDNQLIRMTHNAIDASFATPQRKLTMRQQLDNFEASLD